MRCLIYCFTFLIFGRQAVADGSAHAAYVAGAEFGIVMDQVEVRFRTYKEAMPHVIADAASDMAHEVVAAGVVSAGKITTVIVLLVKADAFAADSRHQVEAGFLPNFGLVKRVEIVKNRPVRLVAVIETLRGLPVDLAVKTQAILKHHAGADTRISSALFRLQGEGLGRRVVIAGRECSADAEGNIELLGMGKVRRQNKGADGAE
jgi:hypothetical protein